MSLHITPLAAMGLVPKLTHLAQRAVKCIVMCSASTLVYTTFQKYPAKAEEKSPTELEKFTQKFAPPKEIQETIEQNKHLIDHRLKVQRIPGSQPSVFLKRVDANPREQELPLYRIINRERLNKCIKANNLTTVSVPKKYIYKLDGQWEVFTEDAGADKDYLSRQTLTVKEAQEMALLAKETGYRDWSNHNVLRNKESDNLVIIDTENRAFGQSPYINKAQYIQRMCYRLNISIDLMNEEAKEWCFNYQNYLEKKPEGQEICTPLPRSTKYDDFNIDFSKVVHEFKRTKKYNDLVESFDKKCIDYHFDNMIPCNRIIKNLEKLSHKLATEHQVHMNDLVGKRKESVDFWKSKKD